MFIQLFTYVYFSGHMIYSHAEVSLLFPYEIHTLVVSLQLEYKTKQRIDRNTETSEHYHLILMHFDRFLLEAFI